jgi:hypothetical protein
LNVGLISGLDDDETSLGQLANARKARDWATSYVDCDFSPVYDLSHSTYKRAMPLFALPNG